MSDIFADWREVVEVCAVSGDVSGIPLRWRVELKTERNLSAVMKKIVIFDYVLDTPPQQTCK